MIKYIQRDDTMLIVNEELLDPNGNPTIIEISLDDYNKLRGV